MTAPPPQSLLTILRSMEPNGTRAAKMLVSAHERTTSLDECAPEQCCYCCREALESVLGKKGEHRLGTELTNLVAAAEAADDGTGMTIIPRRAIEDYEKLVANYKRDRNRRLKELVESRSESPSPYADDTVISLTKLNRTLNIRLHGTATRDESARLYSETLAIMDTLFPPISARLPVLDALIANERPEENELSALKLAAAVPAQLNYFFAHLDNQRWFVLLEAGGFLIPPSGGLSWPASIYLRRLVDTDPEFVADWLESLQPRELTGAQVFSLLVLAGAAGPGCSGFVLRALRAHGRSRHLILRVATLISEEATDWEASELFNIADQALSFALGDNHHSSDFSYEVTLLVRSAVGAAASLDAEQCAEIFMRKLNAFADANPSAVRYLADIQTVSLDADRDSVVEIMVAAAITLLAQMRESGIPIKRRIELTRKLCPAYVSSRILSAHLASEELNVE